MRTASFIFFVLVGLTTIGCTQAQQQGGRAATPQVLNLAPAEFIQKIKGTEQPQLLDVRSPGEWAEGKIGSSNCLRHDDAAFAEKVSALDKNKPVFVYCRSGGRSPIAAKALLDLGFKEVYNLQGGGFEDLKRAGIH
jgi:phage shock protein E